MNVSLEVSLRACVCLYIIFNQIRNAAAIIKIERNKHNRKYSKEMLMKMFWLERRQTGNFNEQSLP